MIKVKLKGFDDLKKELRAFPEKLQARIIRNALDRATRKVRASAKASNLFKDRTGKLRKSIKLDRKKPKKGEVGADVVATAPYAHLVEYGHVMKTANGQTVGHVPAKPFLRTAFEEHKDSFADDVIAEARKLIAESFQKMFGGA